MSLTKALHDVPERCSSPVYYTGVTHGEPSSINGPYIVEVWGGCIPEEVVPVGAMNGSDQATPNSLPRTGNGSRDMKYSDKKVLQVAQGGQPIMVQGMVQGQKKSRDRGLELITLKDVGEDHREIHYRVQMSTEMGKVKRSYSKRLGVPITSLRFLFNGRQINDDETPRQLKMENDDVIEVYQE